MLTTARLALSPLAPDDAAFFYDLCDHRTEDERASGAEWPTSFLTEAMGRFGNGYAIEATRAALDARGLCVYELTT